MRDITSVTVTADREAKSSLCKALPVGTSLADLSLVIEKGDSATPTPGSFEPVRRYVNDLDIQFSISEADLRFGQTGGSPDDVSKVVGWLVTTPVHLVAFARTLDRAIARYCERFGPMPVDDSGGVD